MEMELQPEHRDKEVRQHKKLVTLWRNIRGSFALLLLILYLASGFYLAFNLDVFVDDSLKPSYRTCLYVAYAVYMCSFAGVLWDYVLNWIDEDYFLVFLVEITFIAFVVIGIWCFYLFMKESIIFWKDDWISSRCLAPISGVVFFLTFFYKVFSDGDNVA